MPVPTNRPCQRKRLPDLVFGTGDEKWHAIVEEIRELHRQGRPVLIGTRSIDKSVILSKLLAAQAASSTRCSTPTRSPPEAEIVAEAGQPGKVTVATNMAGRGTDIKLGPGVAEPGGLHVICTELHDSARIDRQLMGRCGRQGDPGTVRQYMSLDDDVIRTGFGPETAEKMTALGKREPTRSSTCGCFSGPSARSSGGTCATASCSSITKKNARRCSARWGRIRISIRRIRRHQKSFS